MSGINRRNMLAATSVLALMGKQAWAQAPAAAPAPAPKSNIPDTDWSQFGGNLASQRYSPLDQINAENFNKLELAWKFNTDSLGPDARRLFQFHAPDHQRPHLHHRRHAPRRGVPGRRHRRTALVVSP